MRVTHNLYKLLLSINVNYDCMLLSIFMYSYWLILDSDLYKLHKDTETVWNNILFQPNTVLKVDKQYRKLLTL